MFYFYSNYKIENQKKTQTVVRNCDTNHSVSTELIPKNPTILVGSTPTCPISIGIVGDINSLLQSRDKMFLTNGAVAGDGNGILGIKFGCVSYPLLSTPFSILFNLSVLKLCELCGIYIYCLFGETPCVLLQ